MFKSKCPKKFEFQSNANKTCVMNDPLGQTHSSANGDHYSRFNFVLFLPDFERFGCTYGRTTCVKIVITSGRDCDRPSGSINCFLRTL